MDDVVIGQNDTQPTIHDDTDQNDGHNDTTQIEQSDTQQIALHDTPIKFLAKNSS